MQIKYLTAFVASAVLSVGVASLPTILAPVQANPCAGKVENPGAAADPCAANPCAANPCAANPCAADPCAADPCAANPCAADPCAAADVVTAYDPPHTEVYAENGSDLAIRGADPVAYLPKGQRCPVFLTTSTSGMVPPGGLAALTT